MGAQFLEADQTCLRTSVTSTLYQRGLSRCCGRVEVLARRVELGFVGIGQPRHVHDARDAGLRTVRVIEEGLVATRMSLRMKLRAW